MSVRQDHDPNETRTSTGSRPQGRAIRMERGADTAARGGVSLWSVLSGMLVAFGAFVILLATIGAILAATGIAEGGIRADEMADLGLGVGVSLVLSQFLAYLWGGYTAGRMARGSGVANGVLVPVVALVLVVALGTIVAAVTGAAAELDPSDVQRVPLPLSRLTDLGTGVGIGLLLAMLGGGALGGWLGARWHTRLESSP
jgi:hypothetical protein